jgi:hypothetical protein
MWPATLEEVDVRRLLENTVGKSPATFGLWVCGTLILLACVLWRRRWRD